jgi:flagellar basal-body rod protein FlgG
MTRGLYIAGTGMLLQRRQMENITNNITNADTTGFKKKILVSHSFDSVMIRRINDTEVLGNRHRVGPLHLGTQVDQLHIDFSEGNLEVTELTTDLALIGDAFFVVETPDGERYTKDGAFYVDNLGYLVDGRGNYVLGENGRINVGGLNFSVNDQGVVWVDNEIVDTLRTASFADNQTLRNQGDNLFFATVDPLAESNPYLIRQGVVEASNVDIGREMVDMITTFRTYETNQRMITMIDEINGKAANEIGRLR